MGDEIRIKVSDELDKLILEISEEIGVKKTEYVKGLVIEDLKNILDKSLNNPLLVPKKGKDNE